MFFKLQGEFAMEIQVVQTRTVVVPVTGQRCEDCEEEERQQRLEEENLLEEDRVSLSADSRDRLEAATASAEGGLEDEGEDEDGDRPSSRIGPKSDLELSEEERQVLQELKARDREVRAHEGAHKAAAGPYANGGPTFEYQTGPDGRRYAVGGEVSIDTSEVPGNPRATLQKAQTIKRAALAPSQPSAQDRSVAARATRMEAEARRELNEQRAEEQEELRPTNNDSSPSESASTSQTGESGGSSTSTNPGRERTIRQFAPAVTTGDIIDLLS